MSLNYSNFVHLHNHSEYSFLDGAMKINNMIAKAKEQEAPALALTDHGGIFGGLEFHFACQKAGIKPILGFEAYISSGSRKSKEGNRNHIILLAKNNIGWQNIMKLSSIGYTEGFYYKPRIDMEVLKAHSEGIIATSACIAGAVPQAIIKGDREKAIKITDEYLSIFGEGNFYYEIQNHGIDDEHIAFEQMIDIGNEKGVPIIVANDAHYVNKDDSKAHEVLLAMQTNAKMSDPKRFRFPSNEFYMKSPEEMAQLFPNVPEAISNTIEIAQQCSVDPTHKALLPSVGIPEEHGDITEGEYLRGLAYDGCKKLYGEELSDEVKDRLEYELKVIISMGFPGYYLIVMDFLLEADRLGIMRGVRGSAAGSLVGYAIGISNVDPLRYDLLFERFLNPERVSMPDVDADFADADREKVINYCVEKYGRNAVCQIINIGRMMAKAAIKDVARVMEVPVSDSQKLANMVEEKTIQKSIDANKDLRDLLEANSLYREVVQYAQKLEGLARQPGTHAAGLIIAPGDVTNWAPLFKQAGEGNPTMTQFDMKYVEESGLIKMDFLGLRTLTVLQNTIKLVKKNHGKEYDLWKDILDGDEKTYREIFQKGQTIEIFQFESAGMRKHLKKLKANRMEDLIAMTALYRPGPMDNIDSFIRRKHGEEKIEYPHPMLKDILDVTYGIIIYQEQVMRIAQHMGGFSLGMADILRKAMGKKNHDVMDQMKVKFMEGAEKQDIKTSIADAVWALMAKFAEYGFNKAHACVYAHVSYQSAYFKAHYPKEYMAAVMTSRMGDKERFVSATEEAKRIGIDVLPPNVNTSDIACGVHGESITIGLGAIASVGKAAIEIVTSRKDGVQFDDIFDFCSSLNLKNVSKKALESLVYAGAMDSFVGGRAQNFTAVSNAVDYGKKEQEERDRGQISLFGGESDIELPKPTLPEVDEWDHFTTLANEKEVLNFYISGHPLEAYRDEVDGFSTFNFKEENVKKVLNRKDIVIGGVITSVKKVFAKKDGRPMAFMGFEDFYGDGELMCFSDSYEKFGELCKVDEMVLVRGTIEKEIDTFVDKDGKETKKEKCKVAINKMLPLSQSRESLAKSVVVKMSTIGLDSSHINQIYQTCEEHKGGCSLILVVQTANGNEFKMVSKGVSISPKVNTINKLRALDGVDSVLIKQSKKGH